MLASNLVYAQKDFLVLGPYTQLKENIIEEIRSAPHIIFFTAGKIYFKMGNYDKAIEMFEKSSKINTGCAPSSYNLGASYYKKGDYEKALEAFKDAIKRDNEYTLAYYSLGLLYFEINDFDNAIISLSSAVALQPSNPQINFDLAQSYVARFRENELEGNGNYDDLYIALDYLKNAEKISPGFPYAIDNINVIESILSTREELIGS